MPNFLSPKKNKTDKPNSILGHNPRLPCINATDIQIISHLGQGSQGLVTKVHTKMIGTCAMKKFRTKQPVQYFGQGEFVNESVDRENQERTVDLVREIKYCSQVDNHPNIVSFYAYVTEYDKDDANNTIPKVHRGILMEYMPGGSLDHYLDNQLLHNVFNPDRVQKWALQIARALAFCHCVHNVIHRDVKPSNILLSQDYDTVKLSDFGIARENKGDKSVGKGTPQFQAPETFDHHDYDTKADVYSYGCLLYAMTTQRRPFDEKSRENQFVFYNYLKDDNNRPPLSDEPLFKQLNEIINKCWKFDPKDRPTMHDIVCKLDKSS